MGFSFEIFSNVKDLVFLVLFFPFWSRGGISECLSFLLFWIPCKLSSTRVTFCASQNILPMVLGLQSWSSMNNIFDLNPPSKQVIAVSWLISSIMLYVCLKRPKYARRVSSSLCLILARSLLVLGIFLAVLNLSKKGFSKSRQESMVPGLSNTKPS